MKEKLVYTLCDGSIWLPLALHMWLTVEFLPNYDEAHGTALTLWYAACTTIRRVSYTLPMRPDFMTRHWAGLAAGGSVYY